MDSDRLPRKLAAILYADVAGYSRLTGDDEDATHRALSGHLDMISATVAKHGGQVMHYAGDAVLAMLATLHGELNHIDEARRFGDQVLRINPGFTITKWQRGRRYRDRKLMERELNSLRSAGLAG